MNKAEEYIKAYTRGNSNELVHGGYHEWLTPENALAAVELAREELMKDAIEGGCFSYKNGYVHISCDIDEHLTDIKIGDKVKVIIIKE